MKDESTLPAAWSQMHRFFVPPHLLQEQLVIMPVEQARQIYSVLRMRPAQSILVLDDNGWEYELILTTVTKKLVAGEILTKRPCSGEPKSQITLFQSVLKRDKFEWVLQKCTELGVSCFVPLISQRSILQDPTTIKPNKLSRWHRIITEAAEQSRRGRIPKLEAPITLREAVKNLSAYQRTFICWEQPEGLAMNSAVVVGSTEPAALAIFIGPEGGFAENEIENGKQYGLTPITLGRRILRSETAAVVVTTLALSALGELG